MAINKFDPTKYGAKPFNPTEFGAKPVSASFPTQEPAQVKRSFNERLAGFIGGEKIAKGLGQTIAMPGSSKLVNETQKVDSELQRKTIDLIRKFKSEGRDTSSLEATLKSLTGDIVKTGNTMEQYLNPNNLKPKEVIGDALQLATTATIGLKTPASLPAKIAQGAGTGYVLDVAQGLKTGEEQPFKPGIGATVGGAVPLAGAVIKPVVKVVGRLFKGLGSGLSGVGTGTIDEIMKNPKLAAQVSKEISKGGNAKVLDANARAVVDGVSLIRKQASESYRKGLEALAKEDIAPKTFRSATQKFLDSVGAVQIKGKTVLNNVEFDNPKNLKKATSLINKLSKTDLDGKSLRDLIHQIDNSSYKIATTDERLSFNAFTKDLSTAIKTAVNDSTDKLGEINKAYSKDIQLAEGIESIFGKVKFKNLAEINKISQQLESLFSKKGLTPEYIDDFLDRTGIGQGLKTSEAVRQISNVSQKANAKGLTVGEILQQVTSSVVTPKAIGDIAIVTGWTEKTLSPVLKKLAPAARVSFLKLITGYNEPAE